METNGKTTWLETPAGQNLQESLSNQKILSGLDHLLNRIDTLEQAVEKLTMVMERGPGMVSMAADMADEAYRNAANNGVDIEQRLGNALEIAEKLTAPAMMEKLDNLLKLADQVPGLVSISMDAADEVFKKSAENGVYIEERIGNALSMAEKLTAPEMMEKMDNLLKLADQAPGLVSITIDAADEVFRKSAENGVYIEERIGNALSMAEKLTAPEMVEKLNGLLQLADQAPGLISIAMDSFDDQMKQLNQSGLDFQSLTELAQNAIAAMSQAKHMPDAKVGGIFSMLRTMRDPDRQRAIGFVMNIAKAFGQEMKKNK